MTLIGEVLTKDNKRFKIVGIDSVAKGAHPWYPSKGVILQPIDEKGNYCGDSISITKKEFNNLCHLG